VKRKSDPYSDRVVKRRRDIDRKSRATRRYTCENFIEQLKKRKMRDSLFGIPEVKEEESAAEIS